MARLDGPARQVLIEANLGVARDLAKQRKYRRWGLPYDDLLQEARLGLCLAAKTYDPDQNPGVEFGSYARAKIVECMWEAITRHRRSMAVSELPDDFDVEEPADSAADRFESEVAEAIETLRDEEQQLLSRRFGLDGHEPTGLIGLADLYGCSVSTIKRLLAIARGHLKVELERRGWTEAKAREAAEIGRAMLA
jgi:RNA polymerase sigma factor (sigma-70 family)